MNISAFKQGFLEKCASLGLTTEQTSALLEKSAFDVQKSWQDLTGAFKGPNVNWQSLAQNPLAHTALGAGAGAIGGGMLGGAGGLVGGSLLGAGAGALGSDMLNSGPAGLMAGPRKWISNLFSNSKPGNKPVNRPQAPNVPLEPKPPGMLEEIGTEAGGYAPWETVPTVYSRTKAGIQAARNAQQVAAAGGKLNALRTGFSAAPAGKVLPYASMALSAAGAYQGAMNPEEMVDQAGIGSALYGGLDPYHGGKNIGAFANLATTGDTWRGMPRVLPGMQHSLDAANYKAQDLTDFIARNPGIDLEQVKSYFARHGHLPGG
jgi:hypothetical protein